MLYILTGQDDYSIRQSLEEIKKGIGDRELLAANTLTLDGQQVTLEQLRNVCETVPFLAEKRLVVISGLLGRFEPKSKPGRKKKSTGAANQQNGHKALADCIGKIPDSTVLVLIDGIIKGNNPLFRELSAKAKVKSFPLLKGAPLSQWIQKRVGEMGGSMSPQAVNLLAGFVGGNLWTMANEIDKLVLFASGRRVEEDDVRALVSSAQETNVFAMIDAILEFKTAVAEQSLRQLLQKGAAPAYLLVMLARQVQMVTRAKELKSQGKSKARFRIDWV